MLQARRTKDTPRRPGARCHPAVGSGNLEYGGGVLGERTTSAETWVPIALAVPPASIVHERSPIPHPAGEAPYDEGSFCPRAFFVPAKQTDASTARMVDRLGQGVARRDHTRDTFVGPTGRPVTLVSLSTPCFTRISYNTIRGNLYAHPSS